MHSNNHATAQTLTAEREQAFLNEQFSKFDNYKTVIQVLNKK
jgi:hypothetical protein